MTAEAIGHEFVDVIPETLVPGTVYVCIRYATAVHLCCCGCGGEVVTPFSPADWRLTYDGDTVSLTPSIGNWSFPCRSHYWIERDRVRWAPNWGDERVNEGRIEDRRQRDQHYEGVRPPPVGLFRRLVCRLVRIVRRGR